MADEKIPERIANSAPSTEVIKVRLDQLVLEFDSYSHRAEQSRDRAALEPLLNSIRAEGLRHRPEVYRQGDDKYVVVTGHRRVLCLRLLAQDGVDGFATDMEVEVFELRDTSELDRLAWSVADNETRVNLTAGERLGVVKKFLKAGMPDERGADALGLSLKQYRRDCTLARNQWMVELVDGNAIPATLAVELLEAADKKGRLQQLREHLEKWVAEVEEEIESEKATRELKPAEAMVKSRLTRELRQHWLEQLASGKELDNRAGRKIKVDLNPRTLEVAVEGFKLNLATDPVEDIARVLGALSQIAKHAAPILRTRSAIEAPEGPQAKLLNAKEKPGLDDEFLRDAGLKDLFQQRHEPPFGRNPDDKAPGKTGEEASG